MYKFIKTQQSFVFIDMYMDNQARSSLYANPQLRAHRRAEKKKKSKKNMEDRLPEPITLQTRQNSIGKFLCTMRL